jgi:hypothetical protein
MPQGRAQTESPFQVGRRLNRAELVDREDELRTVTDVLLGAGKLFVIGPRRHGKTSLIHVAAQAAEAEGVAVLVFDAEAFASVELLAARIIGEAAQRLESSVTRAGEAVASFFAQLRPIVTYNPTEQTYSVSIGAERPARDALPFLVDALDGVERWAAKKRRRVAVVIDEVQTLLESGGEDAERQFRASVQQHERVGYVFAGSRTHYLARITSEPDAPFFNLGSRLHIGAIPDDAFRVFLRKAFARGGFTLSPEGVDAILALAERVPYNVQLLADACWQALRSSGADANRAWDESDVVRVAETMVVKLDPFYSPLWTQLTRLQQTALIAFVHERESGLMSQAVFARFGMTASGMQRALGALVEKGILFEEQARGREQLRLQDPFFSIWVRRYVAVP